MKRLLGAVSGSFQTGCLPTGFLICVTPGIHASRDISTSLYVIAIAMLDFESVFGRMAEFIFFVRTKKTEPKENRPKMAQAYFQILYSLMMPINGTSCADDEQCRVHAAR